MFKKIVISALAFTFALAVALPASAIDREERGLKAPRGHAAPQVTSNQAKISVAGHGKADQLRFTTRQVSSQGQRPDFFQKAECSFICGDWIVTCSGEAVGCTDSSCVASGGGREIGAVCVYE
jgi:hypothetical protein